MNNRILLTAGGGVAAMLVITGCVTKNVDSADATVVTVDSTTTECRVSSSSARSGTLSFKVSNKADRVTEFYLLAEDGLRIVAEVENVAPGVTRDLVLQAQPGSYQTLCKPGMLGEGVGRAPFTVTGDRVTVTGDMQQQVDAAVANYASYVKDQTGQLITATETFLNSYVAGDDEAARSRYATGRSHYERIEPVVESFGDLDAQIDAREDDVPGDDEWTGWHRIEKDLWPPAPSENDGIPYTPLTPQERQFFADRLAADTRSLYDAVHSADYSISLDMISNGAIALMDEVASVKVTGEEETWSHTDLWDMQGNLEGARVAYQIVRDILLEKNPQLAKDLDTRFEALQQHLSQYGSLQTGFVSYTDLTPAQVRALSDHVNAAAEPLSTMTAFLIG